MARRLKTDAGPFDATAPIRLERGIFLALG